ncbi:GerAB/ArcD/ProY family transporter [Niallia endozanthoxylica]|uniref:GerAB/ArcD/ProY family transporter n=1 Tax=Niallia endozanthoxylica TaxID=2036016 RepID=A0A5J5HTF6_9BACI|nr:GerAB/ArcD/ProY family transporter [Niallia endozanthoxylica]KAA9023648.1 GerAB/ArcD/ProY family transporter [Niallia endozanthoxylica]
MLQGSVQERMQISPYMAAYVIVAMQTGMGVLGFQQIIVKDAGYDAWISVVGAGLTVHILVWIMYKICEAVDGDVLYANVYLFGKVIGNSVNTLFIFYYILACLGSLGGLIEIIRTWMFIDLNPFVFAAIYLLAGIYIVYGGFRTVAGISFLGLIIPSYLLLSFLIPLKYGDFSNLLPVLDHTPMELLKSGYNMTFTFLGYGILLFFYPFIKNPKQSKKWVHLGLLGNTCIYTALAIISFAYFPIGLLEKSIWPTLEMWKIVRLPFIERFEYLGIANWALIMLPNVAISLWIASRVAKRVYQFNQRKTVIIIAFVCLIFVSFLQSRDKMNLLFDFHSKVGFALAYLYTPILYVGLLIKKKVKTK